MESRSSSARLVKFANRSFIDPFIDKTSLKFTYSVFKHADGISRYVASSHGMTKEF